MIVSLGHSQWEKDTARVRIKANALPASAYSLFQVIKRKVCLVQTLKKYIYFAYVCWVVLLVTNSDLYLFFLLWGSLFIKDLCLIYMYACFAWMWICVPLVCGVNRSQKRLSDTVELELQMAVSCKAGTVNWSPELINSNLSAIFSALDIYLLIATGHSNIVKKFSFWEFCSSKVIATNAREIIIMCRIYTFNHWC